MKEKITTGANDRPKHETIAQTGDGLPDDSGQVIEVDKAGIAKVRGQLSPEDDDDRQGPSDEDDRPEAGRESAAR